MYHLSRTKLSIGILVMGFLLSGEALAQYSCQHAPCIVASANGWIVGEVRTFAFGEDVKKLIMKELATKGWLECAGQPLSRASYKELFNTVGDTWGSQDGKTDFNLPDLRGQFLRGWNHNGSQPYQAAFGGDPDAAGRTAPRNFSPGGTDGNPGDAVGSLEDGLVGPHEHRTNGFGYAMLHNVEFGNGIGGLYNNGGAHFDTSAVIGDPHENRPHNSYVMFAIYTGIPSTIGANNLPSPLGVAGKRIIGTKEPAPSSKP